MKQYAIIKAAILILLLFFLAGVGLAEVPKTINYQGQLTDPDTGDPLDGFYSMEFYLFYQPDGGTETLLWSESQTVEVDGSQGGVFNIQLGANTPLEVDDFEVDNIAGADLYLEIRILHSTSGWQTLAPRQPLTSTAFAMKAGDADTLEGQGAAAFAPADHEHDAVYVNTGEANSITSAMVADNAIGSSDLAADSVGAGQISTGAVGSSEVADNSLTATDLAEGSVRTSEIADGEVTKADFAKGAVMAAVLDEDGSGSGLDADLLDGNNSSFFATWAHNHDTSYVNVTGDTMTGPLIVEGLLAVGNHAAQPAYNSIGVGTPSSTSISNANDLYVKESIEVAINMYVDGAIYLGTDSEDDDDSIYMDSGTEYLRWDESENDFLFSDDLRVTGEYAYSSPRTYYLNIPPAAFVPTGTSDETWVTDVDRAYISGGGGSSPFSVQVVAPVMLPQDATVTGFRLYYYDDSVLSLSISGYLSRSRVTSTRSVVQLATIGSTTSTGDDNTIDYVEDTSISYAAVENQDYQYAVYASFVVPGSTIGSALSFCGARVTYTVDRVGN